MRATVLLLATGVAGAALAQTPTASPSPSANVSLERPVLPPVDMASKEAKLPGPPRPATGSTADAGSLKEVRGTSIGNGEARLVVAGAARTVRTGQLLLGDVIKAIGDGRIVLERRDADGGSAVVVMSFDAQGRATVRVIAAQDRTAGPAAKP